MAQQNEILVGRFGQLANKLFGIHHANPAPQLAPEVMLVADLTEPPAENRYLMDDRLCQGSVDTTGAAGKKAGAFINLSPATDNLMLATVYRVSISNPTATAYEVLMGFSGGVPAVVTPGVGFGARAFVDARLLGTPRAVCDGVTDHTTMTAIGPLIGAYMVPASGYIVVDLDIILRRGSQLALFCATVAVELLVTFQWHERTAAPGENL